MNTYHDNLSQTITDLLQQRSVACDNVSSQLVVAETNLRYASEAVIAAKDAHRQLTTELSEQVTFAQRTAHVKLLGNNENQRATSAAQYMKQAVTNAAVCAANMQITANSVVKMASDVASAWSLVNAMDADTEIYRLATETRDLINDAAYDAEVASQLSMTVSIQAAEVPAAELADRSKVTLGLLAPLSNATAQAKDVGEQAVVKAEAALAKTLEGQNAAQATKAAIATQVQAAKESYAFAGKTLNNDPEREESPQANRVAANAIAIAKKEEIEALMLDIQKMQREVDDMQAIVEGLAERAARTQEILVAADAVRLTALNNRNSCEGLVQAVYTLLQNSTITLGEVEEADKTTRELATQFKATLDKLIHAAEAVNKLASLIVRKKALNPLISDDLIRIINTAGSDANNSIALALVALRSVFEAETSNRVACSEIAAENLLATGLCKAVAGEKGKTSKQAPLQEMFGTAYDKLSANYTLAFEANDIATKELNNATTELNKLQLKLKTLQAGLAAANAAALAT